jgi:hypothetical protein
MKRKAASAAKTSRKATRSLAPKAVGSRKAAAVKGGTIRKVDRQT